MARSRIVNLANFEQFTAINVLSDPGHLGGPKIIPSCAEIDVVWTLEDGKIAHNVLIGQYTGAFHGSTTEAEAIRAAITTGGTWTSLAAFFATTSALSAVTIRDLNTANNPVISSTGTSTPGTSASPSLPNEVALTVTIRTGKTGPANRGRFFVPGWATNALGAGNVAAAAAVTALNTWAGSTLAVAMSTQGYNLGVGQVARGGYTGSTGTVHPARTAGFVPRSGIVVRDNHWDSQRRRGLK